MEHLIWLTSMAAPWVELAALGVFILITVIYLASSAQPLVKELRVTCPESRKQLRARLKINIFRNPRKIGKGLDVIGCPPFSEREVTCSKACLLTHKAQEFHQVVLAQHIEESRTLVAPKTF
jgi:hypothetical protein